jgi:hypothetical protein
MISFVNMISLFKVIQLAQLEGGSPTEDRPPLAADHQVAVV